MKHKRAVSYVLTLLLMLSVAFGNTGVAFAATAGTYTGTATTTSTSEYFQVKLTSDGEWVGGTQYNVIHTITVGGVNRPAYCVESQKDSPLGGGYTNINASEMGYSGKTLNGLREIIRNGYPYTRNINGSALSATEAQAATQIAVRMWLSHQRNAENADYSVSKMYDPEPPASAGAARIRVGTGTNAAAVYNAALSLYRAAKSGSVTAFGVAASAKGALQLPTVENGNFVATIKKCR